METKWYISIERHGFTPARMDYTEYSQAKKDYKQFNLLKDEEKSIADGRVWLCRKDGTALHVNYFSLETKLPQKEA